MIFKATAIDTHAKQSAPGSNYAAASKLAVNGGGSSDIAQAFISFGRLGMPPGATVTYARLRFYLAAAVSGTTSLTAKRVTETWKETTLTYNNRPAVSGTHSASPSSPGTAPVGTLIEFNVASMLQDVADSTANKFLGFRIELSQHKTVQLFSSEYGDEALRPELELTWTEPPQPPTGLAPDGDDVQVSDEFPILRWTFNDHVASTDLGATQGALRVQLSQDLNDLPDDDDGSPEYDTGKVTSTEASWDSDDGGFGGVGDGETWYWRVKVWDGTDYESEWSDVATFGRTDLGSLSLTSPGATVAETTPPVSWTLTSATQARYKVTLYEVDTDTGVETQLGDPIADSGTDNSVTLPAKTIKTGPTYRVYVEVWDDVARAKVTREDGDDHLTEVQDFTYVRDNTPDPVTNLDVSAHIDTDSGQPTAAVDITFERATQPDYLCLVVDGEEVDDRIDPADCALDATHYRIVYWGLSPRVEADISVEAVIIDTGVHTHSGSNPEVSYTPRPVGIYLVQEADHPSSDAGAYVAIFGNDEVDLTIGEAGTTYTPVGSQAPVRILDIIRGYEGAVSGTLLSIEARDEFLALKELDSDLRLILGDLSFPIRLEEAHASPTPSPGDLEFRISFGFFQVGAPWPVAQ